MTDFVRRRLSQGDLDLFIVAHQRFVEGRAGGRRLSLKFVDLMGLNLSGRILDDADLSGSSLENASLVGTSLGRALLFGCDLRGADMTGARMKRADIRGVSLRGANLTQADLTQADFREGVTAFLQKRAPVWAGV